MCIYDLTKREEFRRGEHATVRLNVTDRHEKPFRLCHNSSLGTKGENFLPAVSQPAFPLRTHIQIDSKLRVTECDRAAVAVREVQTVNLFIH